MDLQKQKAVLAGILLADLVLGIGILLVVSGVLGPGGFRQTSAGQEYMEPKVAALTFDDGPNHEYTELLLQGLRERDVKASFFLIGESIEGNEALIKQMVEDGHLIGVHCMQHTELTKEKVDHAIAQLESAKDRIEEVTGNQVEYLRPPFGSWNEVLDETVRAELDMEPVFWDVDSRDWELRSTSAIVKKVVRDTENGDIILMHDEFGTSVDAAFQIIDNLMAKGYTFVTVNELMVD
ncbi:MAG: polysaccharide deacetylase family protein [Lachnospiraceae bacterium]|nr:polysaccharide deacetylase family protein [Lachnospiraceae bacterium]